MTTAILTATAETAESTRYMQLADSADYYLKREKYAEAEYYLLQALRSEPDNNSNYLLLSNLGVARRQLGNIRGALEALDAGVAMAPKSTVLRVNRAQTYMVIDRTDEALDDLENALKTDSLLETPLTIASMLYLDRNKPEKARPLIERLIKHYPSKASGYIAKANLKIKEGSIIDALPLFKEAIKLDANEEYYQMVIMACLDAGLLPEADEFIMKALDKYPRQGNLYVLRAISHKKKYQNDLAALDIRLAKEYRADDDLLQLYGRLR